MEPIINEYDAAETAASTPGLFLIRTITMQFVCQRELFHCKLFGSSCCWSKHAIQWQESCLVHLKCRVDANPGKHFYVGIIMPYVGPRNTRIYDNEQGYRMSQEMHLAPPTQNIRSNPSVGIKMSAFAPRKTTF